MRRKKAARKKATKKAVRRVGAKRAARKLARKAVRRKVVRKAVRRKVAAKAVRKAAVRKAVRKKAIAKAMQAPRSKAPAAPGAVDEDEAVEDEFESSGPEPLDLFTPDAEEPESGGEDEDGGKW